MRDAKSEVFVDADEAELEPLVAGKGQRRGCKVDDLGLDQGVFLTEVRDAAPAGRQYVPIPGRIPAESSRHDKAVAARAHPQGCGIQAAGAATDMVQDPEDG